MKKIFLIALFVSTFALLAGTVYGEETGSTDGSALFPEEASSDAENLPNELPELQPEVMGDMEGMRTAADLASDPAFQARAYDPEIVNAVKSLDFKTLIAKQKAADAALHQGSGDQETQ